MQIEIYQIVKLPTCRNILCVHVYVYVHTREAKCVGNIIDVVTVMRQARINIIMATS